MNTTIDTAAIRAEWEPRARISIYGVEITSDDARTVLALCDEVDALRAHYAADWQRAEDALLAAGVEMYEHGDRITIEDGIARLAERGRADGLAIATLMDMTGAASPDDLVRVVGQMMRAAREAPKG